jgi:hypothetical protein
MKTWWWNTELTKADVEAQSSRDPVIVSTDLDEEQLMEYSEPGVTE